MSLDSVHVSRTPGFLQGVVLLLPITLAVMGIAVLVPAVPLLMERFQQIPGHVYLIQGGVLTSPALCVAALSPLAGWLADRMGRRPLLIASMTIYSLAGMAPLALDNLYAIVASRIGVGVCEALIMTVSTTLIGDYFTGPARERWLASQTAVASITSLILIPLGGLLAHSYGWRGPFVVYALSLVFVVLVWRFTWEPPRDRTETRPARDRPESAPSLPWRSLGGICAVTLFASVMFYTVQTQSAVALTGLGVHDPSRLGWLTAVASLGVPVGTFLFPALSRLPLRYLLTLEFAFIAAGFAWMGKADEPYLFVAAAAVNQIGCGMILPTLLTWAARGLPFETRGRGIGIWTGTFTIGQFLSGILVTYLATRMNGLREALIALGVGNLIAAALTLLPPLISPGDVPKQYKRFPPS
jgi:MFS family permease